MTMKSDAKFEEKLICCFKNDKKMVKSVLSTQNLKMFTSIGSFCTKYITFDLKRTERIFEDISRYFMTLKSHAKFEENLSCGLENNIRKMVNFH